MSVVAKRPYCEPSVHHAGTARWHTLDRATTRLAGPPGVAATGLPAVRPFADLVRVAEVYARVPILPTGGQTILRWLRVIFRAALAWDGIARWLMAERSRPPSPARTPSRENFTRLTIPARSIPRRCGVPPHHSTTPRYGTGPYRYGAKTESRSGNTGFWNHVYRREHRPGGPSGEGTSRPPKILPCATPNPGLRKFALARLRGRDERRRQRTHRRYTK